MNRIRFSLVFSLLITLLASFEVAHSQANVTYFRRGGFLTPSCQLDIEALADGTFQFVATGISGLKFTGAWPLPQTLQGEAGQDRYLEYSTVDSRPDEETDETLKIFFAANLQPTGYDFSNRQSYLRSHKIIEFKTCRGLERIRP